jgi:hypothetical protein
VSLQFVVRFTDGRTASAAVADVRAALSSPAFLAQVETALRVPAGSVAPLALIVYERTVQPTAAPTLNCINRSPYCNEPGNVVLRGAFSVISLKLGSWLTHSKLLHVRWN